MSARVNLLPREIEERARARRTTSWVIGGVAAYAALLGLLYIAKLNAVSSAESERDEAQGEVTRLQAEVDSLAEYAELDQQVATKEVLLTTTMATEISWARVLNDLALTFPPNSSMVTFVATTGEAADESGQAAATSASAESVAGVTFEGYSVDRLAPGVERVLLKFDDVETYFNSYLTEAQDVQRGRTTVTQFNGTFQLNDGAYTQRYAEGLPPEAGQ